MPKRKRVDDDSAAAPRPLKKQNNATSGPSNGEMVVETRPKYKVRKLDPVRPFPVVPASVSATGPRSAHKEGKNMICITRKTELAAYMRRCKDVLVKDDYKTLHLHAMGAAIPHLLLLVASLPLILPFPRDEIHTDLKTLTVECQDEIIPEDEDEDITYQLRGKSALSVVIRIGDVPLEKEPPLVEKPPKKKNNKRWKLKSKDKKKENEGGNDEIQLLEEQEDGGQDDEENADEPEMVVYEEGEQEEEPETLFEA